MTTNNNKINPKKPVNFFCELCNFKCSYNKDFQRHINTKKHKNNILTTNNNNINPKKPDAKIYQCENCEKVFNDRAVLLLVVLLFVVLFVIDFSLDNSINLF